MIMARQIRLATLAKEKLSRMSSLYVLGNPELPQLAMLSFVIRNDVSGEVSIVLSEIQTEARFCNRVFLFFPSSSSVYKNWWNWFLIDLLADRLKHGGYFVIKHVAVTIILLSRAVSSPSLRVRPAERPLRHPGEGGGGDAAHSREENVRDRGRESEGKANYDTRMKENCEWSLVGL